MNKAKPKQSICLIKPGVMIIPTDVLKEYHQYLIQQSADNFLDYHIWTELVVLLDKMTYNKNGLDLMDWEEHLEFFRIKIKYELKMAGKSDRIVDMVTFSRKAKLKRLQ